MLLHGTVESQQYLLVVGIFRNMIMYLASFVTSYKIDSEITCIISSDRKYYIAEKFDGKLNLVV